MPASPCRCVSCHKMRSRPSKGTHTWVELHACASACAWSALVTCVCCVTCSDTEQPLAVVVRASHQKASQANMNHSMATLTHLIFLLSYRDLAGGGHVARTPSAPSGSACQLSFKVYQRQHGARIKDSKDSLAAEPVTCARCLSNCQLLQPRMNMERPTT